MTVYLDRMTMLSTRLDDEVAERIDAWCEQHDTTRSDFVREALRRELNRRLAFDEAEFIAALARNDDESVGDLMAIEAWGPQEDWSEWHAALDKRDVSDAATVRSGAGDDSPG